MITLKQFIFIKTGLRTPAFCRKYNFPETTIKSWSNPKTSKAYRNPKRSALISLSRILKVPLSELMDIINENK